MRVDVAQLDGVDPDPTTDQGTDDPFLLRWTFREALDVGDQQYVARSQGWEQFREVLSWLACDGGPVLTRRRWPAANTGILDGCILLTIKLTVMSGDDVNYGLHLSSPKFTCEACFRDLNTCVYAHEPCFRCSSSARRTFSRSRSCDPSASCSIMVHEGEWGVVSWSGEYRHHTPRTCTPSPVGCRV
jgi:hypothetical protein